MREVIFTAILCMLGADVLAQSISIREITPNSPANLVLGRQVTVSFEYELKDAGDVQIFVRPFTSGSLTPNYAASGSPVYRGNGSGTASFTIQSQSATVDQIRVQAMSTQNKLLFEFYLPVKFKFSPQILMQFQPRELAIAESANDGRAVERKAVILSEKNTVRDIIQVPDCSNNNEILKKLVKPDGTLELHYSDGSIVGILSAGKMGGVSRYRIDPVTRDTTYTQLLFNQVQAAYPPGFVGTETAISEEWLQSLNAWIENHGDRLLGRIDNLLDDEAYAGYLAYEENADLSIYEKVNFRYTFLERIVE